MADILVEDYIVLSKPISQTKAVRESSGQEFGAQILVSKQQRDNPISEPVFSKERLDEKQLAEASNDPDKDVFLDMPLVLVGPTSEESSTASLADFTAFQHANGQTWGVNEVLNNTPENIDGKGVKVAILDTGIDPNHPAFEGKNILLKDYTHSDGIDRNGHGTHCAGTIAGKETGGIRIGVAPGVNDILVAKVLDDQGRGSAANLLAAMKWAHENGANVISMSLGFDFTILQNNFIDRGDPLRVATSKALKAYRDHLNLFQSLTDYIHQETNTYSGTTMIAACGNESDRNNSPQFLIDVSVPAATSSEIVSVGATSNNKDLMGIASFSNTGPSLCAPGVDILSAGLNNDLVYLSGTSMACPHVAGVAALYWQSIREHVGVATGTTVRSKLLGNATLERLSPDLKYSDRGVGCVQSPHEQ